MLVINAQVPSARLFCQVAAQAWYGVTAYLTAEAAGVTAEAYGRHVTLVRGDLLNRAALAQVHAGNDTVVFFWEGSLHHPLTVNRYLEGLRNVVYAMQANGLTRLVVVHAGRTWWDRLIMVAWDRWVRGVVADQVQALLQASGLQYLSITAGALRNGRYRTRTVVSPASASPTGAVNRLDLVDFLLQRLYQDRLDATAVHVSG